MVTLDPEELQLQTGFENDPMASRFQFTYRLSGVRLNSLPSSSRLGWGSPPSDEMTRLEGLLQMPFSMAAELKYDFRGRGVFLGNAG